MKALYITIVVMILPNVICSQESDSLKMDSGQLAKILAEQTDKAINQDRKDLVAVYYNSFYAMNSDYDFPEEYHEYFEQLTTNFKEDVGQWMIGLEFPPKVMPEIFVHMGKLPPGERGRLIKGLDSLKISAKDLQEFSTFRKLQKQGVDFKKVNNARSRELQINNGVIRQ